MKIGEPQERADGWVSAAVEEFRRGVKRDENFRRLYDYYYEPIRKFFGKRVFSPEDCLDLTQETFLGVYRGLESYRGEARFGTWLFRIAYNTHLKWLRRAKARDGDPEKAGTGEQDSVALDNGEIVIVSSQRTALDRVLQSERQELLRQAIDELPEQMRRCVKLRVYRDLSLKEVSVVLKRSIETVKVHVFQARKKLKEKLKDIEEVDL